MLASTAAVESALGQLLYDCLRELPDRQRAVVVLVLRYDLTREHIATILRTTRNAIDQMFADKNERGGPRPGIYTRLRRCIEAKQAHRLEEEAP